MNDTSSSAGSGGFGIGMLVFIVFLILKLTHTIDWRWFWVCSPLWISAGFVVFFIIVVAILSVIFSR